jgi:hypothetical protein
MVKADVARVACCTAAIDNHGVFTS